MKKNKIKLDDFHYHEALDRAYCVANIIEDMLVNHPVIKTHKEVNDCVKKAQKQILKAYTIIGGIDKI